VTQGLGHHDSLRCKRGPHHAACLRWHCACCLWHSRVFGVLWWENARTCTRWVAGRRSLEYFGWCLCKPRVTFFVKFHTDAPHGALTSPGGSRAGRVGALQGRLRKLGIIVRAQAKHVPPRTYVMLQVAWCAAAAPFSRIHTNGSEAFADTRNTLSCCSSCSCSRCSRRHSHRLRQLLPGPAPPLPAGRSRASGPC
jgi:hypothetical protein